MIAVRSAKCQCLKRTPSLEFDAETLGEGIRHLTISPGAGREATPGRELLGYAGGIDKRGRRWPTPLLSPCTSVILPSCPGIELG
jgi:hypothetical protein